MTARSCDDCFAKCDRRITQYENMCVNDPDELKPQDPSIVGDARLNELKFILDGVVKIYTEDGDTLTEHSGFGVAPSQIAPRRPELGVHAVRAFCAALGRIDHRGMDSDPGVELGLDQRPRSRCRCWTNYS